MYKYPCLHTINIFIHINTLLILERFPTLGQPLWSSCPPDNTDSEFHCKFRYDRSDSLVDLDNPAVVLYSHPIDTF